MKSNKQYAVILGVLALSLGGVAVSAQATALHCTSEECACEAALEQNTVEALEEFLKKYPQSVNNNDSACAAMAVPLDDGQSAPDGQSHDGSSISEESTLTPSES